jgi:hypothetical protein
MMCWTLLFALAGEPAALTPEAFRDLHRELARGKAEKWQTIPWKVDLLEAREAAAGAGKPLFIWSMNGHPLGCTRFHLIDNTRGEPPLWRSREVRAAEIALHREEGRLRLSGTVQLKTEGGDRGYEPSLLGYLESRDGKVTRLDLVARGEFWGQGRYTGGAPPGRFTLAVAFALAAGGEASRVPPQGARDLGDYLGR